MKNKQSGEEVERERERRNAWKKEYFHFCLQLVRNIKF